MFNKLNSPYPDDRNGGPSNSSDGRVGIEKITILIRPLFNDVSYLE